MAASSVEPSAFLNLIAGAIDPDHFYENMLYLSGGAAVVPWLFVVFVAFRLGRESLDGIQGKAALFEAFASVNKTLLFYLIYAALGFTFFFALFGLANLFEGMGSQQMIHDELISFRGQVLKSEETAYDDFIVTLLKKVSWAGNLMSEGVLWTGYQGVSSIYVLFNQGIEMAFALGVGLTYFWGFIAIPTMTLKGELNLMKGWGLAIATLFIWAILEPVLLGFLWFMLQGGGDLVKAFGSGVSTAAMAGWYLLAIVTMVAIMLVRLFALGAAVKLASNEAPMSSLGTLVGAPTLLALNNVISRMQSMSSGFLNDSSPQVGGDRLRDSGAGLLNSSLGDVGRSAMRGMGDLSNRLRGGGEDAGGQAFEDLGQTDPDVEGAQPSTNPEQGDSMADGDDLQSSGRSDSDTRGGDNS